jgi:hypothetical protein
VWCCREVGGRSQLKQRKKSLGLLIPVPSGVESKPEEPRSSSMFRPAWCRVPWECPPLLGSRGQSPLCPPAVPSLSHTSPGLIHGWGKYFLSILMTTQLTHALQKNFSIFPSPAGMPLTKLSLGGNNDVIYKLIPPRESLVSDIPAGDGNIENLVQYYKKGFERCLFVRNYHHFRQTFRFSVFPKFKNNFFCFQAKLISYKYLKFFAIT